MVLGIRRGKHIAMMDPYDTVVHASPDAEHMLKDAPAGWVQHADTLTTPLEFVFCLKCHEETQQTRRPETCWRKLSVLVQFETNGAPTGCFLKQKTRGDFTARRSLFRLDEIFSEPHDDACRVQPFQEFDDQNLLALCKKVLEIVSRLKRPSVTWNTLPMRDLGDISCGKQTTMFFMRGVPKANWVPNVMAIRSRRSSAFKPQNDSWRMQ